MFILCNAQQVQCNFVGGVINGETLLTAYHDTVLLHLTNKIPPKNPGYTPVIRGEYSGTC